MGLYSQFKTDESLERDGIILDYGLNADGTRIGIRIARAGGSNMRYLKLMEQLAKPYKRQIQNDTFDSATAIKLTKEAYAKAVVITWENVQDENGQPIPFSIENCLKLFDDLPDLYSDIVSQADKAALFRTEILEADTKN